jgi:TrpR-related protein YerC/YecD
MKQRQKEQYEFLFDAILSLENKEECERFFEDLCTVRELQDMSDRLKVAELLINHDTYEEISEKTKISSATISRINRAIQYGNGGYQEIILKLKR